MFEGDQPAAALIVLQLMECAWFIAGLAGVTYYYCDMLAPDKATFPALELWTQ